MTTDRVAARFGSSVAASLALAMTVAACGDQGAPIEPAGPPPSKATTSVTIVPRVPGPVPATLPHSGAPKITNPLPAELLDRSPCSALNFGQLATVFPEVPAPKESSVPAGAVCSWQPAEAKAPRLTVTYARTGQGLSAIYRAHDERGSYLRAMPAVRAYPSVAFDSAPVPPDERVRCRAAVGISDNRVFWVEYQVTPAQKGNVAPCPQVTKVADLILTNLGAA